MLYEVITTDQPIGVLAMYYTAMYGLANMRHHCIELQKKLDAGSRVKKETNAEMICKDIDKLAEALFIADVQWNGACSAEIDESTRITSYNVCYTKLLRAQTE